MRCRRDRFYCCCPKQNAGTCRVGSTPSHSQYAAAAGTVAALTAQFFSGLGPSNNTFGPGSAASQVMAQSPGVQDALNGYNIYGRTSGNYNFAYPMGTPIRATTYSSHVDELRGGLTCAMRSKASSAVRKRSHLMAAAVSMATFMLLCAVALPRMETSLVFIPILTLSAVAGGIAWAATRFTARRSARIS
jgi:hypothetical protein